MIASGRAADRMWSRLRGLIGSAPLRDGDGLWISPCNGIHMFFMAFPIDAVYLSAEGTVVALDPDMAPWRVGRIHRDARSVLELPAGTIAATSTQVGDRIDIEISEESGR